MSCDITNNSDMDIDELSPLIDDLASHVQDKMKMKSLPAITMQDDSENANSILGRTAQYDPQSRVITVYVTSRHPKDIMRSIAHEMIHHVQNERGDFDNLGAVGEGYAQSDEHLRNMEKEAYLKGNMCFRDWEDGYKRQMMESIHRQNSFKRRNNTMKIHKWKNNELNKLLMEKFNLGEGNYNRDDDEEEKLEESAEMEAAAKDYLRAKAAGDEKTMGEIARYYPGVEEAAAAMERREGSEIQEGELPQGLKDYQEKKKGKKSSDGEETEDKEEKQEESIRHQIRNKLEEILNIN